MEQQLKDHIMFMKNAGVEDFDIAIWVKGYNKAKETLYTEEQMMEYAEWIFNLDTHTVLTMPKEALLQEFINQSLNK
jgi:hypothetical protein